VLVARLPTFLLAALLFVGGELFWSHDPATAREAQAMPGTFVSSLTLQNPSGNDAIAAVNFVNAAGQYALPNPMTVTVPANASALVYLPNVPGLANGRYSAVIDSTNSLYMIANLLSSGPTTASSFGGLSQTEAGTSFFVPSVYKNYVGRYTSSIVVQNADTANAARVRVDYRDGAGNVAGFDEATIPANASVTFDQANQSALPSGFVGSATIASDRAVGAVFNVSDPINRLFSSSRGFKDGATVAYLPVIYNDYSVDKWVSSFLVQNVDAADADIRVTYSDGRTATTTIRPGAFRLYYQGSDGTPLGFNGSVVIQSTNAKKIAAVGNVQNAQGNLSAYNAFTTGTRIVDLPVIYNNYSSLGWTTSFTIQNVDTVPTNLTVRFSNNTVKTFNDLQPGASALFYQPNDGLPSNFNGAATVTSTTARIVGVVNELGVARPNPGDWLLTYDGFNR
jgi:hypothetical protein